MTDSTILTAIAAQPGGKRAGLAAGARRNAETGGQSVGGPPTGPGRPVALPGLVEKTVRGRGFAQIPAPSTVGAWGRT